MKFKLSARISGVIEAPNAQQAKNFFRQGYDLSYVVDQLQADILPDNDESKSLNAVLTKRKQKENNEPERVSRR